MLLATTNVFFVLYKNAVLQMTTCNFIVAHYTAYETCLYSKNHDPYWNEYFVCITLPRTINGFAMVSLTIILYGCCVQVLCDPEEDPRVKSPPPTCEGTEATSRREQGGTDDQGSRNGALWDGHAALQLPGQGHGCICRSHREDAATQHGHLARRKGPCVCTCFSLWQ